MSWLKMDARWNGTCSICSIPIPEGTSIFWENYSKKIKHEICDFKPIMNTKKNNTPNSENLVTNNSKDNKTVLPPILCANYYTTTDRRSSESKKNDLSKIIIDNKPKNNLNQKQCLEAATKLSKTMFEKIKESHSELLNEIDLIVPVPNNRSVPSFSRGVSIGKILASLMEKSFGEEALVKAKNVYRKNKNRLNREKLANESYDISSEISSDNNIIKNKKILLVDDVRVGGSTTEKCAKLLIENGARQVQIICATQCN
jgi:adenine/guanine phosphoribosyltransferase-like PRPP-binding protein